MSLDSPLGYTAPRPEGGEAGRRGTDWDLLVSQLEAGPSELGPEADSGILAAADGPAVPASPAGLGKRWHLARALLDPEDAFLSLELSDDDADPPSVPYAAERAPL